jgi:hypothetical protein
MKMTAFRDTAQRNLAISHRPNDEGSKVPRKRESAFTTLHDATPEKNNNPHWPRREPEIPKHFPLFYLVHLTAKYDKVYRPPLDSVLY